MLWTNRPLTVWLEYHKNSKTWDTYKITVPVLKWNSLVFNSVMHLKDADGMANSVDLDQAAPLGLHWP